MTSIQIREATEIDALDIVRITNSAYEIEHFCIAGDRTDLKDVLSRMSKGTFFIAVSKDSPETTPEAIGSVFLEFQKDRGYMGTLAVHPTHQGKGISKQLISAVERATLSAGFSFLDITVLNLRTDLFPFYSALSFAPTATETFTRPANVIKPVHLIRMTKALRPAHEL